jgi:iron complex outermembrane recepter protein
MDSTIRGGLLVKSLHRAFLCGVSVAAFVLPAMAQDSLETVTVTGIRESLRSSLAQKLNTDAITENISTKDIGQLPDVTIAEELNRLPGLNTTTDRGNASQAAVRGLGPRLILGLVNGREVASPEPDQNVRWEIYPSEVVTGVQVFKSQSADLLSGGIAATIDLQTLSPLDWGGPTFTLRVGPEYNDQANDLPYYTPWGVRASTAYVTKLTDRLAIALSASFQREKNGYESFQGWGYNLADSGTAGDVTGDGINDSTPWGMQSQVKETTQDRMALMGAVGWQASENLLIKLDTLYSAYTIHEDQFEAWYGNNNAMGNYTYPQGAGVCSGANQSAYDCGWADPPVTVENGVITGAQMGNSWVSVTNGIERYKERHSLAAGGLNATWTQGEWTVKGDLSHSDAWRNNTWVGILSEVYPTTSVFNTAAGAVPYYETYSDWNAKTLYDPANAAAQWIQTYRPSQISGPEHTMDSLSAARFDAERTFSGSMLAKLAFGLRYAVRKKSHTQNSWYECPTTGASLANTCANGAGLPTALLSEFNVTGYHVPNMLYGDFDEIAKAVYSDYNNGFAVPAGSDNPAQHWTVLEDTFEGYLKAGFATEIAGIPTTGNIGVRIAHVSSRSRGFLTTNGSTYSASHDGKNYTDVLPSFTVNFRTTDDQVIRFGGSIAVSRPPLDELRVGNTLSTQAPWTGSRGNPLLNPYRADQLDLAYEWYFHEESLFSIATYYKHLNSFIGYKTFNEVVNSHPYVIATPINGHGGDVSGMELTLQSRFYFLPGFLQDFGFYGNYAYVSSGVKEYTPSINPFEATGLARHTAELDLWYSAHNIEARVAYKVHSATTGVGWDASKIFREGWSRDLGASLSYQISENISVRLEGRNLTDSKYRTYWDNNPSELNTYSIYGRSFLFDVTFKN